MQSTSEVLEIAKAAIGRDERLQCIGTTRIVRGYVQSVVGNQIVFESGESVNAQMVSAYLLPHRVSSRAMVA